METKFEIIVLCQGCGDSNYITDGKTLCNNCLKESCLGYWLGDCETCEYLDVADHKPLCNHLKTNL